jgi:hypothetical protein
MQAAKYFAIESMHGARRVPVDSTIPKRLKTSLADAVAFISGVERSEYNLLRRFARPNELYFLMTPKALRTLFDAGLSRE